MYRARKWIEKPLNVLGPYAGARKSITREPRRVDLASNKRSPSDPRRLGA